MSENVSTTQAFKLKGRLYTLTILQLLDTNKDKFLEQCAQTIIKAPKLFQATPVVLDVSMLGHEEIDLSVLCQIARGHGIIPIAIQGASDFLEEIARDQGLAVLHVSSDKTTAERSEACGPNFGKTKIITAPVRSGQQVVAQASDLIITSTVNHGAELLADGSIHVYGSLRGRALAGISGDKEARIFCQSLEAQLVAIAGCYRLSDAIEPINSPCQIYLRDEHIHIEPL